MKNLIVILALVATPAFAAQLVQETGTANGRNCSVAIQVEQNGFVSAINVSGRAIVEQAGYADSTKEFVMDFSNPGTYAQYRFTQAPMLTTYGTVLHTYYDTGLATADEITVNIYGDLLNPTSVVLASSQDEGPLVVKAPVYTDLLTCSDLY